MERKIADKINFSIAPVREIQEISPIISKARVRIFYTGLNRNLTYITEEFAEKLLRTLPYTPVGGLWQQDEEDFSDHGGPGESNRERFQAFGVVPENPNVAWEDHMDEDGVLRRYACCDVYLWTARYKAAREIPKKAQSMELYVNSINGEWKRDGALEYFEFTDGVFFGLLALGDDVDPCFEGAAFYGLDNSAKEFFEELKNYTLSAKQELIGGTEMEIEKIEETPVVEEQVEEVASEEEVVTEEATEEVQEVATEETEEEAPAAEEVTETTEETADDNAVENFENEEVAEENEEETEEEAEESEENEEVEEVVEETTDIQAEYQSALQRIADLEAQVASYENQVNELTTYKNDAERVKKTSLIEKYSLLLGEEACANYTAKIDEYSFEDLKKEISVAVLECNEESLFSKNESQEVIINVDMTKNYSGAARLMSKYFKD